MIGWARRLSVTTLVWISHLTMLVLAAGWASWTNVAIPWNAPAATVNGWVEFGAHAGPADRRA